MTGIYQVYTFWKFIYLVYARYTLFLNVNTLVLYKEYTKYIPEFIFLVYTRYKLLIFRVYTRYISGILHFEVCTCPIPKIFLQYARCTAFSVPSPAVMCQAWSISDDCRMLKGEDCIQHILL
jgi:hypothetical protein